jgi:hypothetical protein
MDDAAVVDDQGLGPRPVGIGGEDPRAVVDDRA